MGGWVARWVARWVGGWVARWVGGWVGGRRDLLLGLWHAVVFLDALVVLVHCPLELENGFDWGGWVGGWVVE